VKLLIINPPVLCFNADTQILCRVSNKEKYVAVQELKSGDLVKTCSRGYKPIVKIIHMPIYNNHNDYKNNNNKKDMLFRCPTANYPDLFQDLILTGSHSILVKDINDTVRDNIQEMWGNIFVTDDHYRLPACIDDRAAAYDPVGTFDVYHFALENDCEYSNYGVFANGLLVESVSKHHLKT